MFNSADFPVNYWEIPLDNAMKNGRFQFEDTMRAEMWPTCAVGTLFQYLAVLDGGLIPNLRPEVKDLGMEFMHAVTDGYREYIWFGAIRRRRAVKRARLVYDQLKEWSQEQVAA